MGKSKQLWETQQEEEEALLEEARLERIRLFEQDEIGSEDDETGFDFERDQGARP